MVLRRAYRMYVLLETKMSIGAYVLTDKRTGKFYVGSSQDIRKRLDRHYRDLKNQEHHCPGLQHLWNKYGRLVETIFPTDTREEAYALEQDLIDRHLMSSLLLNIGTGVKGGDNLSRHPDRDNIIRRIHESMQKKLVDMTPLERKLLYAKYGQANGMYGRTHTPEARKIMSEVGSRIENVERLHAIRDLPAYRDGLSRAAKLRVGEKNTFYGKTHSEETKRLLSEKLKGQLPPNLKKVEVDGATYESLTDAGRKLGISPALMVYRIKSDKYPTYQYLTKSPTTTESA